jgi:3-deoxy-D-manno-octulosonic-acid transferase
MPRPSFPHRLYRSLISILPRAARLGGDRLVEQIDATGRWTAWAEASRPEGPLLWVHGASVGELLTATPVIRRLQRLARLTVVCSHTSRSVAGRPPPFPTAWTDYLPLDTPQDTARTLDAVRPDCLALSRGDVWPEFLLQAQWRGIPVAVLGGAIGSRSRRLRHPVRSLYASRIRAVSWIGAVSPEDAQRWQRIGARPTTIEVTGDPRHDEVLERVTDLRAIAPYRAWASLGSVLVAGSVELRDLQPLFITWRAVRHDTPAARLLIVPHDPASTTLARVATTAARYGERLLIGADAAAAHLENARCIAHDGFGTLPDLYTLGCAAYVGGGFSRGGVHSVIEPAALGLPILAGPHATDDPDARAMIREGGLVTGGDPERLSRAWRGWVSDPEACARAGLGARRVLSTGAAERSAEAILSILNESRRGVTA